ncbi:isopentenyl transferase family protein [Streptomyces cylindrosporus]|uniref:Isopentenyl transferase family protein n=1 Tax=Streptomyces cylindrosporus TaxID=2927583 RepID=A0ABS9YC71_9ACTN|nr:isopentenyl transferase family protein [Streptomyces cylindrosporus]MCI3273496.1 isopentenyl transferase family protein [Streptomyces cylindrosporus]
MEGQVQDSDVIPVHLIAGPTGTGKSQAATNLALRTGSTIVVADRLQCYAEIATTSTRTGADTPGTHRVWLCERTVADGDYSAEEAVDNLVEQLTLAASPGAPVIVEGGSISLLILLAAHLDRLPWAVTPTLLTRPSAPGQYVKNLAARAAAMLRPTPPQPGLLQELAHLWRDPVNRWFAASVNGFEAALEWCAKYSLDPQDPAAEAIPNSLLDELSTMIAERHMEHGTCQEKIFRDLFSEWKSDAFTVRSA